MRLPETFVVLRCPIAGVVEAALTAALFGQPKPASPDAE
jgi:hypothetical protein